MRGDSCRCQANPTAVEDRFAVRHVLPALEVSLLLYERGEDGDVRSGDWNAGPNGRAVPALALERQPAAERLDSIAETAQSAAVLGAGSTHSIVGDDDRSPAIVAVQRHLHGA